jgi:hypothetical protein
MSAPIRGIVVSLASVKAVRSTAADDRPASLDQVPTMRGYGPATLIFSAIFHSAISEAAGFLFAP